MRYLWFRYTDMVNSLATVGEDPNQLNQFGEAPLCMAAYRWVHQHFPEIVPKFLGLLGAFSALR
jgi:hypothetical protein